MLARGRGGPELPPGLGVRRRQGGREVAALDGREGRCRSPPASGRFAAKAVTPQTPSPQSKCWRADVEAPSCRQVLECGDGKVEGKSPLWMGERAGVGVRPLRAVSPPKR